MTGVQETLCTRCSHREVCSFKDDFLRAVEAVNEVTVNCSTKEENAVSFIRLCDIPWIKPVELICKHYSVASNLCTREGVFQDWGISNTESEKG